MLIYDNKELDCQEALQQRKKLFGEAGEGKRKGREKYGD